MNCPNLEQNKDLNNPIDLLENMISSKSWSFERRGLDEIVIEVHGKWDDMLVFFSWEKNMKALHISCLMDIRSEEKNRPQIYELLAVVNDQLWVGHFNLWHEQNMPVFKHSILIDNTKTLIPERLEEVMNIAIKECEKFYPAFQNIIWNGKSQDETISALLLDTMGEA